MQLRIEGYLLPALVTPEQLAGQTVVVIDVLRATTTIMYALAAGAKQVVPCLEIEEARQKARSLQGPAVLGGERQGGKIAGFDLGNSPAEYTPEAVGGKSVFFTTTNGTLAMRVGRQARRVLLGAFVNLKALCRELEHDAEISLVCAGTDGQITREDVLLAGAIASELIQRWGIANVGLNDQARIAVDAWSACEQSGVPLDICLLASQGGRNLSQIGQGGDIQLAAQLDCFSIVPELLLAEWKIVADRP